MKNQKHTIDHFELSSNSRAGIMIVNMENQISDHHDVSKPHRDNHCQLMLALGGEYRLNIDFENIEFKGAALICVFPEQVHHIIEVQQPKGWMVGFDPSLVGKEVLEFLEINIHNPFLFEKDSAFLKDLITLMELMDKVERYNVNNFNQKSIHAMLNGLLSLIAGNLASNLPEKREKDNRSAVIKEAFLKLLKEHFKVWKQPAQYASALAISTSHLNDTVKSLTGSPVSVHIQDASIMEAKRLLYFTENTVREVAYQVGYDEPVYFGKLFKKVTNLTPLEFRKKFRDQDYPSSF